MGVTQAVRTKANVTSRQNLHRQTYTTVTAYAGQMSCAGELRAVCFWAFLSGLIFVFARIWIGVIRAMMSQADPGRASRRSDPERRPSTRHRDSSHRHRRDSRRRTRGDGNDATVTDTDSSSASSQSDNQQEEIPRHYLKTKTRMVRRIIYDW